MKRTSLATQTPEPVSHNPKIAKRVMLDGRAAPGLTNFSQAVFSPGQVSPGHAHADMYEVFFVRRGRAVFVVDGNDFESGAGECILVEPGEQHRIDNRGEEDLILLYFGLQDREYRG